MITALVHTFNEEKNIERCLLSLVDWVDEIIVVDMGSTDRTVDIAKTLKAKIFNFPYTGFVEPARNFGIEKARGQWLVILDADEEIPRALVTTLKKIVKENQADFCRLKRKNIIFNKWIKHAGWWPDYQIRFFKKGFVTWTDKIHGIPLTRGTGLDIAQSDDQCIIHHNYQSLEQYLIRMNRYTSIAAKDLYLSDERFSLPKLMTSISTEFVNRFFLREGYKDGLHGLALALLQGFSETVVMLKIWELENFKEERIHLKEMERSQGKEFREKQYWLYNEMIKSDHSFVQDIIWRVKRKFYSYG
jgi:(heptosyl)LPS beta-1,4-glucosyltransferase